MAGSLVTSVARAHPGVTARVPVVLVRPSTGTRVLAQLNRRKAQRQCLYPAVRAEAGKAADEKPAAASVFSAEQAEAELAAFRQQQQKVPRISYADEARTLVAGASTAVLSTQSVGKMTEGYPYGSVIDMAADDQGRPVICISTLSLHRSDLQKNPKCSITIAATGFTNLADARVTVTGQITPTTDDEREALRTLFLAKHPNSFYVDFGDFAFFRMDKVVGAHLIGGFGRVAQIPGDEYLAASADPMAAFAMPVATHMNADHGEANTAIVRKYTGIQVEGQAQITGLDRLGMNMTGVYKGMPMKIRVPFPRPAADRKDIKTLIVEMTRASAEFMPQPKE